MDTTLCDKLFVSKLGQVGDFLRVLRFSPPIKNDRHDISEILLKVALNTINQTKHISLQHLWGKMLSLNK
jgi:hypothetical protein